MTQEERLKQIRERTRWFREAEYGFFFHFLNPHKKSFVCSGQEHPWPQKEWNQQVNAFNVERFAEQLHSLHAGYAFLTVGQNSGYYCSPNAAYDRIMGMKDGASRCSDRDLISDFADALAEYHIPLMVYTTALAPYFDRLAVEKFDAVPPWEHMNCGIYNRYLDLVSKDTRMKEFQQKWEEVHAEWSKRWGTKVKGWWVDGPIFKERVYGLPDEPNGDSFVRAMRAGNPDAIVALNEGMFSDAAPCDIRWEDYTAGEINTPEFGIAKGPFIRGAQYHVLTFMGSSWCSRPWRYTGRRMAEITRAITNNGGVISWDMPFSAEDAIEEDAMAILKEFDREYQQSKTLLPKVSVSYTQPKIFADGSAAPGRAVLEGPLDPALSLSWGKTRFKVPDGSRAEFELPAVDPAEDLVLSREGFSVTYPVSCTNELFFTREWSREYEMKKGDDLLAVVRFAVKNGSLLVRGTVFEDGILQPADPEHLCSSGSCSCMVLFISAALPSQTHFFLRPDGNIFSIGDSIVTKMENVSYRCTEPENGKYEIEAELPLADIPGFNGKEFLFNIGVNVMRNGKTASSVLWGGRNKAYVPNYDLAHIQLSSMK